MKNKVKKGLIALLVVSVIGCAGACDLFEFTDSITSSSSPEESVSILESISQESASDSDAQGDEEVTPPADEPEEEGGTVDGEHEDVAPPKEEDAVPPVEEDSSSESASDSSDGKIELPEDKFH